MSSKTSRVSVETKRIPLALSDVYVQLSALEKEHQSLLKQIKRKRTEVKNFMEKMRSLGNELVGQSAPRVQKMSELDREIHTLFNTIFANKKLNKRTRNSVQEVYLHLQVTGIISHKDAQELAEEMSDIPPEANPENYDQYQQSSEEITDVNTRKTDDSRKIRQTFLKLAEIFHPDKVTDNETQISYTEIMKEINQAYQEGDLARLLEIERQHQLGESIDKNNEDDLVRRCKIVQQQNAILKEQYEKLKLELRRVKNTPEGQIVADCRKTAKIGVDYVDVMLKTIDAQVNTIQEIRDFVKSFAEGKITLQEFLRGPADISSVQESMMLEIFEQIMGN